MAVKKVTLTDVSEKGDGSAIQVVWDAATEADTFAAVKLPDSAGRTVSVQGTFGGATVVLNGSIDGTNYTGCTNPAGVAISKTSAAVVGVAESMIWYQPVASGGTGQSLTLSMLFVRGRKYPN